MKLNYIFIHFLQNNENILFGKRVIIELIQELFLQFKHP